MIHPTWELKLDTGALILTPCPGTKIVSLIESLQQLKAQGVSAVVTALSIEEMQQKGVDDLSKQVEALGMKWYHAPIEDDQAPDASFMQQWSALSQALHQHIDKGEKVAMHCMGGSGRTGLLAAHFLLEKDWPLDLIIEQVQALRPGAFTKPDQIEYIRAFAG
ncbi:phosphatase [Vibrio sp. S11_S32]|uniref:cyclin-dependent kinase inhibitor 3 family protein n=1 Tax=Vibrio sp. S11_S32 TaxID=2720225 RepID=UPI00167FFA8F|nr:cyclin-dependent kinase inhibitor 3 family protein [Vibrio sp. S11_S32]MBD1577678.1 phosphatase [Vibrio sp. S11_S32]